MSLSTLACPIEFLHAGLQGGDAFLWSSLLFRWMPYMPALRGATRVSVHPSSLFGIPTSWPPEGRNVSPFTVNVLSSDLVELARVSYTALLEVSPDDPLNASM